MHKLGLLLVTVCAVSCVDQTTKYHAVGHLTAAFAPRAGEAPSLAQRIWRFASESHPRPVRVIPVVEDYWHFRYVENPGGFWSLLSDAPASVRLPVLLVLTLLGMLALVVVYLRTPPDRRIALAALALALGGAAGNFLDRARYGYVIDFIDWHWRRAATWPTFNIADAAITIGIGLLIVDSFRRERQRAS